MRRVFSPGVGSLWDPCSGAHSDRHGNRACGREKRVQKPNNTALPGADFKWNCEGSREIL